MMMYADTMNAFFKMFHSSGETFAMFLLIPSPNVMAKSLKNTNGMSFTCKFGTLDLDFGASVFDGLSYVCQECNLSLLLY